MTTTDTAAHTFDWSDVATGWDRHRESVEETKAEVVNRLLAVLALRPGERVLELGAGTGELARKLASAVGSDGHVYATDAAAGMVELIRKTTADLPNVGTAQMDATDIGGTDATCDAVVFCMGLMFVPQPEQALSEIHRVLKPGGRLAATTWAAPEHNPWLTTIGMSAMMHGLVSGGPPVGPGGVLSLGEPAVLEELATQAGFSNVSVEAIEPTFRFADVDEYVDHVTSLAPPLAAAFATASDDQRKAMRDTVAQATHRFATDDGLDIPARALLLSAAR